MCQETPYIYRNLILTCRWYKSGSWQDLIISSDDIFPTLIPINNPPTHLLISRKIDWNIEHALGRIWTLINIEPTFLVLRVLFSSPHMWIGKSYYEERSKHPGLKGLLIPPGTWKLLEIQIHAIMEKYTPCTNSLHPMISWMVSFKGSLWKITHFICLTYWTNMHPENVIEPILA